jgi:hypothetical protein
MRCTSITLFTHSYPLRLQSLKNLPRNSSACTKSASATVTAIATTPINSKVMGLVALEIRN